MRLSLFDVQYVFITVKFPLWVTRNGPETNQTSHGCFMDAQRHPDPSGNGNSGKGCVCPSPPISPPPAPGQAWDQPMPLLGWAIKIRPLTQAHIFQCVLYFNWIEILWSTNHTFEIRMEWTQPLRVCPSPRKVVSDQRQEPSEKQATCLCSPSHLHRGVVGSWGPVFDMRLWVMQRLLRKVSWGRDWNLSGNYKISDQPCYNQ